MYGGYVESNFVLQNSRWWQAIHTSTYQISESLRTYLSFLNLGIFPEISSEYHQIQNEFNLSR